MISFDVSLKDMRTARKIAVRAVKELNVSGTVRDWHMDVVATHANGCPLRLADLLGSSRPNFAHDLIGIRDNIDRTTGALQNHFRPRYSVE